MAAKYRTVADIAPALRTLEGGGVEIRRGFPTARVEDVDPFLLFDHMGPLDYKPGQATGFPEHPHRGFETVTYVLHGVMEHRDSFGHHGVLEPGDVQWMTAGSGLVHSEMPGASLVKNGGRLEGFQVWVNLPKRDKMKPPAYQEIKASEIPVATSNDGLVVARVIAGETLGVTGAVKTNTPVLYLHVTLAPGGLLTQRVPSSQNAIVYTIGGELTFNGSAQRATESKLATFEHDGDEIQLTNNGASPAEFLLLAGEPLNEPVARYGPFVMNTKDELVQAFEDFRSGKMGAIGN